MVAASPTGAGARPTVILRSCASYDVARVRTIVREGLEELDLRPVGKTLVKPNLVASGKLFTHAHTRPEFFEGVLMALRDRDDGRMTELGVGERSGVTIPTRFSYARAGYDGLIRRTGAKRYCFEEERQVEVPLRHEGRLRDYVFVPQSVINTDFLVNCPKFKAHPWTTVSFSMKNFIGIQDDRHRMIDHDHRLNAKVVDLQHVVQPRFIACDGIIAGQGPMLTPVPFDLGLIVMGDNQVAFDAVCCAIIGLDPRSVEHIRSAHDHGLGPIDLADITVTGDVSLEEARRRAQGFKVGLQRVEEWFEGTNISCYAGPPTEEGVPDYCWGGCPGRCSKPSRCCDVSTLRPTARCRSSTSSSGPTRARSRPSRGRRSSSSAAARRGGAGSGVARSRSTGFPSPAPSATPITPATRTSTRRWPR